MRKLSALRAHVLAAVPQLARDPDRLLTFVVDGRIEYRRGPTLTHEYAGGVRLVITDYSGDPDAVIIPVLAWLNRYEPDLDPKTGIAFDIELIDHNTVDIELTIQLTERVIATVDNTTGQIRARHVVHDYGDEQPSASNEWQLLVASQHGNGEDYQPVARWPAQPAEPSDDG